MLKKYFRTKISLEQLSDIKDSLINASSHFAAGAIKTLTNAWCTSNRFGSHNGQGSRCLFCGEHVDAMQHIIVCPTFRTASIAAFNRATFKINGTHILCNHGIAMTGILLGTKTYEPMHSQKIFESLTHMAVLKNRKSALEMAWWPSYETIISKILHCR